MITCPDGYDVEIFISDSNDIVEAFEKMDKVVYGGGIRKEFIKDYVRELGKAPTEKEIRTYIKECAEDFEGAIQKIKFNKAYNINGYDD